MTKMEYNNSQKGQTICSIFHKVSMVSIVRTFIIRSVKSKRNRLYDQLGEIAMKRHTRKIAIIGTGLVGSSCAYSIVNQGICEELLLIDINHERAVGKQWIYHIALTLQIQEQKYMQEAMKTAKIWTLLLLQQGQHQNQGKVA